MNPLVGPCRQAGKPAPAARGSRRRRPAPDSARPSQRAGDAAKRRS